jgi:hypothetical protein
MTNQRVPGGSGSASDNTAYGVDASVLLANRLLLTSYLVGVSGTALSGGIENRSALRVSAGWRDTFWDATVLLRRFGADFEPGLGFVRRNGAMHQYATAGVHPTVRAFGLQEINPYVEMERYLTLGGVLETRRAAGGIGFAAADGSRASLTFDNVFERLFEPFSVGGSTIGPGEYDANQLDVSYATSSANVVSTSLGFSYGGYFGGTRTAYSTAVAWKPNEHVALDVGLERNEISLPASSVVANVARLRLSVSPTTRVSGSAFVQYNGLTDEVVTSVRVRLIHAPLSDAYLVVEERRSTGGSYSPLQSVALKVTRLLAL